MGPDRVSIHISPGNPFNSMNDFDPAALFGHLVRDISNITRNLRRLFPGPYITNGGYDGNSAMDILSSGGADLVAFGRSFLANPDLPERLKRGGELNEPDPATLYGGWEKGYTDYPFLD